MILRMIYQERVMTSLHRYVTHSCFYMYYASHLVFFVGQLCTFELCNWNPYGQYGLPAGSLATALASMDFLPAHWPQHWPVWTSCRLSSYSIDFLPQHWPVYGLPAGSLATVWLTVHHHTEHGGDGAAPRTGG